MPTLRSSVLSLLLLALAAPALAEESGADAPFDVVAAVVTSLRESGPRTRLFSRAPYQEFRAAAFQQSRLSLWAETRSYTVGVGEPLHDLEGGAALKLLDDWRLTAGYRVRGTFVTSSGGGLDLGLAAPFLKLGHDF